MLTAVAPVLALALLHVVGAGLIAVVGRRPVRVALRRPSSPLVALSVLALASLGLPGVGLLAALVVATWLSRPARPSVDASPVPWPFLGALTALVLARPLVPTQWDEFVWLGKARLEALGFGAGVRAALDSSQHLVPPGYPPSWPSAVGWLSLGQDALPVHTLAASLLQLLAAAAALEAWAPLVERPSPFAVVVALAAPLAWVHLRSVYVDLPVGLLALALLGQLLRSAEARPPVEALALAVVLAGFKDEGLAHVLAATVAAWAVAGRSRAAWRLVLPAVLALSFAGTWRALLAARGISDSDHALAAPYWPWLPRLGALLWLHASDVFSWGVFWAVAVAVMVRGAAGAPARALRWLAAAQLAAIAIGLLCGPERVRVFAENGTLVNRLLMQMWPAAAMAVVLGLASAKRDGSATGCQPGQRHRLRGGALAEGEAHGDVLVARAHLVGRAEHAPHRQPGEGGVLERQRAEAR
jgi:hypothetical protein